MKKKDVISRQDVIDAISKLPVKVDYLGYTWMIANDVLEQIDDIPSAEPEPKWIPFKFRELTEEEKEWHPDWDYMMDCQLPENEQEILVSNGKYVWLDTFYNDNDGCYLDGDMDLDGIAWMPLPEPWKGE